jgi:polygalacturonase
MVSRTDSASVNGLSRRRFLKSSLLGVCAPALMTLTNKSRLHALAQEADNGSDPWKQASQILDRIRPPIFPAREFDIANFGAIGDNRSDCTSAFAKAIAACNKAGGGTVIVPKGDFLTGTVRLKSNVRLYLSGGATVRFTHDLAKYPVALTRFEGVELMNFSPFIYALDEENIAIAGTGTIDGNADEEHWWAWKGGRREGAESVSQANDRKHLFEMAERRVPVNERVFGPGHYLRPNFIEPYRCKNVLIEGVTLQRSPMWQVHPVLCSNVTVRGLTINSSGPNTDGCDPESCADVLIENCFFNTGDDCIAIKSGRNEDGRRVNLPSRNIVVQNCRMRDGHGGVTIGSEVSGGIRNIFAQNCQMDSPHLFSALRIKNNAMRGGEIEGIFARNIEVGQVSIAGVSIDFYYDEGEAGKFTPIVREVQVQNLTTRGAKYALYLRGFAHAPIERVTLANCDFEGVQNANVIEDVKNISFNNVRINGKLVS